MICDKCNKNTLSVTRFYNELLYECDWKRCDFSKIIVDHEYNIPKHYTKVYKEVETKYISNEPRRKTLELMIKMETNEYRKRGLMDELRLLKKTVPVYKVIEKTKICPIFIARCEKLKIK